MYFILGGTFVFILVFLIIVRGMRYTNSQMFTCENCSSEFRPMYFANKEKTDEEGKLYRQLKCPSCSFRGKYIIE